MCWLVCVFCLGFLGWRLGVVLVFGFVLVCLVVVSWFVCWIIGLLLVGYFWSNWWIWLEFCFFLFWSWSWLVLLGWLGVWLCCCSFCIVLGRWWGFFFGLIVIGRIVWCFVGCVGLCVRFWWGRWCCGKFCGWFGNVVIVVWIVFCWYVGGWICGWYGLCWYWWFCWFWWDRFCWVVRVFWWLLFGLVFCLLGGCGRFWLGVGWVLVVCCVGVGWLVFVGFVLKVVGWFFSGWSCCCCVVWGIVIGCGCRGSLVLLVWRSCVVVMVVVVLVFWWRWSVVWFWLLLVCGCCFGLWFCFLGVVEVCGFGCWVDLVLVGWWRVFCLVGWELVGSFGVLLGCSGGWWCCICFLLLGVECWIGCISVWIGLGWCYWCFLWFWWNCCRLLFGCCGVGSIGLSFCGSFWCWVGCGLFVLFLSFFCRWLGCRSWKFWWMSWGVLDVLLVWCFWWIGWCVGRWCFWCVWLCVSLCWWRILSYGIWWSFFWVIVGISCGRWFGCLISCGNIYVLLCFWFVGGWCWWWFWCGLGCNWSWRCWGFCFLLCLCWSCWLWWLWRCLGCICGCRFFCFSVLIFLGCLWCVGFCWCFLVWCRCVVLCCVGLWCGSCFWCIRGCWWLGWIGRLVFWMGFFRLFSVGCCFWNCWLLGCCWRVVLGSVVVWCWWWWWSDLLCWDGWGNRWFCGNFWFCIGCRIFCWICIGFLVWCCFLDGYVLCFWGWIWFVVVVFWVVCCLVGSCLCWVFGCLVWVLVVLVVGYVVIVVVGWCCVWGCVVVLVWCVLGCGFWIVWILGGFCWLGSLVFDSFWGGWFLVVWCVWFVVFLFSDVWWFGRLCICECWLFWYWGLGIGFWYCEVCFWW